MDGFWQWIVITYGFNAIFDGNDMKRLILKLICCYIIE
jgi:hypothetical protein